MNRKWFATLSSVSACILALSLLVGCNSDNETSTSFSLVDSSEREGVNADDAEKDNTNLDDVEKNEGLGKLTLLITDKPIKGEDIKHVNVKISQVMVHQANVGEDIPAVAPEEAIAQEVQPAEEVEKNDKAWVGITPIDPPKELDLMALLGGIKELLGEANLQAGKYTQIRLIVEAGDVVVVEKNGQEVVHPLKLVGGGKLKITRPFEIVAYEDTEILLDFDAEKSLNKTGKGDYLLKPVIKFVREERKPRGGGKSEREKPEGKPEREK